MVRLTECNLEVDSKDEVMHIYERSVIFKEEMFGGRERVTVLRAIGRSALSIDSAAPSRDLLLVQAIDG